jgi:Transposase DDE domain
MGTIPQVSGALRRILTEVADEAAVESGFVRRVRKLSGASFVQGLVFGWLGAPSSSLSELAGAMGAVGTPISRQGLAQRFSMEAAECLRRVLAAAVSEVVMAEPTTVPVLGRFSGVYIQDGTKLVLPEALASSWAGNGGRTGAGSAALKAEIRLELASGQLEGPLLSPGRASDRNAPVQTLPMPAGSLRLADLGYFTLLVFAALSAASVFWLSRYRLPTVLCDPEGGRLDLLAVLKAAKGKPIDRPVRVGSDYRLPARLLAVRVPKAVAAQRRQRIREDARVRQETPSAQKLRLAPWTVLLTNVPEERLSLTEALVLTRVRWQIELVFKLWKSHAQLDEWRSHKPARVLCEIYAKLLALVISHWLLLVSCWHFPDRSLAKAFPILQHFAFYLACSLRSPGRLSRSLADLSRALAAVAHLERRKARPTTYHLLLLCS